MARKRLPSRLHLLSVREVQTAQEGDHSDGGGLTLRVRGTSAAWVFRYTAATGRRREMGLGAAHRNNASLAGSSLTDARELAAKARAELQQGLDPIDEREKRKGAIRRAAELEKAATVRKERTLARAARDYHERVIEPSRSEKHAAQWITSLENHLPPELWHSPIASIEAPDLLDVLLDIYRQVPETAMRIRQRLDAVFEDAIFRGDCSTNPAAATRRKLAEAQGKREKRKFAALPYPEAPALFRRLTASQTIASRCLAVALLTVARTGEITAAEWPEMDLDDQALWIVPPERMKAGETHTVYLSTQAVHLLREQRGIDKRYVFPSPVHQGKPLSNMAMLTLLGRLGMRERTTVHGVCRATFSTWAYETNAARPDVIEACLAHQEEDKVKAAYNRAQFAAERRQLLQAWADFLSTGPA